MSSLTTGKSLKQIEEEARLSKLSESPREAKSSRPKKQGKSLVEKARANQKPISPLGVSNEEQLPSSDEANKVKPLVQIKEPTIKPLTETKMANEVSEPNEVQAKQEPQEVFDDLFDSSFIDKLSEIEVAINEDISNGKIKLIVTNADFNMNNLKDAFDDAFNMTANEVNYEVKDEKKPEYSREMIDAAKRLEKLEMTIDHLKYQNELQVAELEGAKLRGNRYQKRQFEGLEEVGGIEQANHNTSEKNVQIDLQRNTDFTSNSEARERKREEGYVERAEFRQDYEGSDLEGIDSERDKLEQEILAKQESEAKKSKKKKKKTEEQKIEEAKERLRKKQEKRRKKQEKRTKVEDVAEIDLVGNQFDVDELREEKMDRLLEIKKISAQKKEMQKEKEKQRSKATKEFYKYKKVNKKSHIVGFKQN